ncbi:MAG TPA: hypothetical protein VFD32_15850 [Dehalococcoidia bacterium]|nr:hypothetical protein [Dehalococcoidia bacterium]
MSDQAAPSGEALAEAVAAFDAGNHAWGRFRHFVLSAEPSAAGISTRPLRDALREAAICVPDAQAGDYLPLLAALRRTQARLVEYLSALPPSVPRVELDQAAEAFAEAIELLDAPGQVGAGGAEP